MVETANGGSKSTPEPNPQHEESGHARPRSIQTRQDVETTALRRAQQDNAARPGLRSKVAKRPIPKTSTSS